jgi:hypothetical protein
MHDPSLCRRQFLSRVGLGMGALGMASLLKADSAGGPKGMHFPSKAEHVIHIFLNGGMSQVLSQS